MTLIKSSESLTLGSWNSIFSSSSGQLGLKRKPTDTKREAPQLSGTMIKSFWRPLQTAMESSTLLFPLGKTFKLWALRRYSKKQPKRMIKSSSYSSSNSNRWFLPKQGSLRCMHLSKRLSTSRTWSKISRVSGRKKGSPLERTVRWCIHSKIKSEQGIS